ncbi:MAG: putative phosphoesterase [Gammaproteobacteria bacterium]|jgi:predicted MPP superfamily phosphohydrolase|nr:putative phosphoesterase [Gammaproteobacteria bacterium]
MKLIWLTDIHLNFLDTKGRSNFYQEVIQADGDALVISGDIAEAPSAAELLTEMVKTIQKPIYFVLGNHDYYRGQVEEVRIAIRELTEANPLLHWLPACEPILIANDVALVGQDGWADGRYGDYANSRVGINDSRLIDDLFQKKIIGKYPLLEKMQQLADADAERLKQSLQLAINKHHPKQIVVVTHIPPFRESCLHEGEISNDEWLPYFASKATGDVLLAIAEAHPEINFLVLCGHTHSPAEYKPLVNLTVKAGGAEYYEPRVQEVLNLI